MSDLKGTSNINVGFDNFLDVLLWMAAPPQPNSDQSQQTPPGPLLREHCITAVNELCNAPVRRAKETKKRHAARTRVYEESIIAYMKAYCKPGLDEVARYPAFVNLSNAVLELVGAQDSPLNGLLRDPDNTRILFHINHPQPVVLRIDNSDIKRCPDIVIVAEESVKTAFNAPDVQRPQLLKLAAIPTNQKKKLNIRGQFPVTAILSCMEFKKRKDMAEPPDAWLRGKQPPFAEPQAIDHTMAGWEKNYFRDAHASAETSAAANSPATGASPSITTPSTPSSSASWPSAAHHPLEAVNEDEFGFNSQERNIQRAAVETEDDVYHPIVQSASYAMLSLNRAAGVLKVIGMFVEDQTLWLWIYDRQGAIQSYGLDFIKDFPRFVVLLAAFQRFNRQDWGFNPDLEPPPQVDPRAPVKLIFTTPATGTTPLYTYTVTLTNDILYERPTLCGRASHIETVTVERDVEGFNDGKDGYKDEFVLKVGWPESTRISEVKVIAKAKEIADREVKGKRYITGHLPEVICSKDLPESYATGTIRKALGLLPEQMRGGSRTCRLIVLVKLRMLKGLPPLSFLKLFRPIVTCHYFLWIGGVKHCDVSLQNLMWHPGRGVGVLNDFDLSRMEGDQPENLERTGTVPFMSLDILSNPDFQLGRGLVEATYKHDCDSFKWVFLYVCCIDTPDSAVEQWHTNDPDKCLRVKSDFLVPLAGDSHFQVSAEYMELSQQAILVFNDLQEAYREAHSARARHLARLQYKAFADKKIVRQPHGDGAFGSIILAVVDEPKADGELPMPLEEPEEEPAPSPVDPEQLWDAFRRMLA